MSEYGLTNQICEVGDYPSNRSFALEQIAIFNLRNAYRWRNNLRQRLSELAG